MRSPRVDTTDFKSIAEQLSLDPVDVRRAVISFFDSLVVDAKKLPFDSPTKIYSKDKFDSYTKIRNIPSLGRIGPVYSRYLRWRYNDSKNFEFSTRDSYKLRITSADIERYAEDVIAGRNPEPLTKRSRKELYDKVWLVGENGRRQAYQVIPKIKSK